MSINVEVKINYDNDELYCQECKEKISLGEKYCTVLDQLYSGEIENRNLHFDCLPEITEEEYYEGKDDFEQNN
jgi:hypothetical protein